MESSYRSCLRPPGWPRVRCQYDITKAYDNIRWPWLLEEARHADFPLDLLAVLYVIHSSRRIVIIDGAIVFDVMPMISVVAGCAFSDACMHMQS